MQFTESARAKAAALSPKMSPDVQDSNPRKRHSLAITNGKQDTSPRMQRSSSQAQEKVKINVAVPHNPSGKCYNLVPSAFLFGSLVVKTYPNDLVFLSLSLGHSNYLV
jgi:hypothetical protein